MHHGCKYRFRGGQGAKLSWVGFSALLLNVDAENAADLSHRTVYTAGQAAHACCCGKGHQSDNQHILHNALTGFVVVQAIQGLENQVFHYFLLGFSLVKIPSSVGSRWDSPNAVSIGKSQAKMPVRGPHQSASG